MGAANAALLRNYPQDPKNPMTSFLSHPLRGPVVLLMLTSAASTLGFAAWTALINNFAIERAAFSGADIGLVQSVREIPGFLAFAVVFALLWFREQNLAWISLALLGIGTAITGFAPSVIGICATTLLMSVGFHYYETVRNSLSLQWLDKEEAPVVLGQIMAVGSAISIVTYAFIWLTSDLIALDYTWIYLIAGLVVLGAALVARVAYPQFESKVEQHKSMVLRKRYWLYYALVFMSGARRQIFIVFAGFLMVEKFGYSIGQIALLYLLNAVLNVFLAPRIGAWISRFGERQILILEYAGLFVVFALYAFVTDARLAATLYVIDHMFFAMAIAINTYFQKIADPADIAATAGVGFTINHIAAVVLPVLLGVVWLTSPSLVFLIGAGMAVVSLLLALCVPTDPREGNETSIPGFGRAGSITES